MREYKTRKHQIEAFMREAKLPLKTRAEKARFFKAMRDACMVGACEERQRILQILRTLDEFPGSHNFTTYVNLKIMEMPELTMLGFQKGD